MFSSADAAIRSDTAQDFIVLDDEQELAQAVQWMYQNDLTKFDNVQNFEPNTTLTREAAAKFFGVFAQNYLKKQEQRDLYACDFSDKTQANPGLLASIEQACYM